MNWPLFLFDFAVETVVVLARIGVNWWSHHARRPMKPGWQTSEFWTAAITQALALMLVLGFINGDDSAALGEALAKGIAAVFTMIASAWVVVRYIQARTKLKSSPPAGSIAHPDL